MIPSPLKWGGVQVQFFEFEVERRAEIVLKNSHRRKTMLRKISLRKRSATLALLAFGVLLGAAWAQTESVFYGFCAQTNCTDGENPVAGLVFDLKGNLYGTTYSGGAHDRCNYNDHCGVVFKLTPKGEETVLYTFCAQTNCTDGENPYAAVVLDRKGNLYGTTVNGGAHGVGVVFKLTPEGKETVLYSFCAQDNCPDGYDPSSGLVLDQQGNLYGTTQYGGAHGAGIVFKVTPKGKETVLYNFCAQNNCADGAQPMAGLVFDQNGNLYGSTVEGGVVKNCYNGCGVVFKLTPKGKETVLYTFCPQNNCFDGRNPAAGLVFDRKGNLYGTTELGGAGGGTVFELTPKGKETVLYSFCAQNNCTDGSNPAAGLIFDTKGNLYGTTVSGGIYRGSDEVGVVFKLTPKGKETVLHSFCTQYNGYYCADGAYPSAGLVFDQKGNLYGTTIDGGDHNAGVVFKLTP
jgi:uncharacterized repeat protein (TIGR03803 family)